MPFTFFNTMGSIKGSIYYNWVRNFYMVGASCQDLSGTRRPPLPLALTAPAAVLVDVHRNGIWHA